MIDIFNPTMIPAEKQMVDEGFHSTITRDVGIGGRGQSCLLVEPNDDHDSCSTQKQLPNNKKKLVLLRQQWYHQHEEGVGLPLTPRRKTVTFAQTCRVKLHIARADYSTEEIMACWYSKEEVTERRRKSMLIVVKLRLGEGDRYCIRGLENLVPEVAARRLLLRQKACSTVLREQDYQRLKQLYDPEALASRYRDVSARCCRTAAYQIGCEDALVAMKVNSQGMRGWKQILRRRS